MEIKEKTIRMAIKKKPTEPPRYRRRPLKRAELSMTLSYFKNPKITKRTNQPKNPKLQTEEEINAENRDRKCRTTPD